MLTKEFSSQGVCLPYPLPSNVSSELRDNSYRLKKPRCALVWHLIPTKFVLKELPLGLL
jgi:hypothetical protein